eukprot:CAMPEP_0202712416 /NCGR_PEP_ID=MMETSP1385-20130828/39678_1 /ASSEMBLY_ACC=CAM_ASM_000861 /TAXON_ID=933848 /ORGANISM="Elphidium margaritaceum" /LENGTH=132 /DNA_ID=CAMNT_0049372441 /DNA_START=317 /DNA_END=715 /DNA_ORIENTATION=-
MIDERGLSGHNEKSTQNDDDNSLSQTSTMNSNFQKHVIFNMQYDEDTENAISFVVASQQQSQWPTFSEVFSSFAHQNAFEVEKLKFYFDGKHIEDLSVSINAVIDLSHLQKMRASSKSNQASEYVIQIKPNI